MGGRIAQKSGALSYYIMPCLFFFGNIKFIKMILAYVGVTTGITAIASGIFAILETVLVYYFLHQTVSRKRWGIFAIAVAINTIYALPYVLNGMLYELVQYAVFMIPFTVAACLIISDENGLQKFFDCIGNISKIAVWLFLVYIVVLFVCEPGEYGVIEIKEMSYGDIAYATLPFLLIDSETYFICDNKKKGIFAGLRVLVYIIVLIYTGTRSAILCMGVAFILQIVRNFRNILHMGIRRVVCSLLSVVLCVGFCLTVVPNGSRLNVVKSDVVYELQGEGLDSIFDNPLVGEDGELGFSNLPISYVYNVETKQYMDISKAFEHYIVNNDKTITETQEILHKDITDKTEKYLIVNPEFYNNARNFKLPMNNRTYLFSTAWNEFKTSPAIGHGALYYQQKYEGKFPHNIVFEIMADFGIVGLLVLAVIILYTYFYAISAAFKTSKRGLGILLTFLTMYIPMHLLYHSLYSNGVFIFTVSILVLYRIKNKKAKA